ncbi:AMP-binding protein [Aquisalimonas lutea]|uniref:AMP-binding protein n=1 Tax=Aquisalimonas lutea TaxID=1327750 RepID=UPI0025B567FF|nr:AMP-binding protein [Aquisalimonas lutea]MDN3517124.1 AMP-binding protein [Aquisalimonas lutea]
MNHRHAAPLLWRDGRPLPRDEVLARAARLGRRMAGDQAPVLNLCDRRDRFITGFIAALAAGRRTVLPPSPAAEVIADLRSRLDIGLTLDDDWVGHHAAGNDEPGPTPPTGLPGDDDRRPAATLYTSGSTGAPTPHERRWDQFVQGARLLNRALGLADREPHHLVATTPPQHMYGLEASVLLPLVAGHSIHAGRPLLPEDLRSALAQLPQPRGLITTPLHLRTCLEESERAWPRVEVTVSATAPLEPELAARAEAALGGAVYEIYGSTETGAMAWRRPTCETLWSPMPGVRLAPADGRWHASGRHFPPCSLADQLDLRDDGRFALQGRDADLVKIAGKRGSLSAIHQALVSVPGVMDAVVLPPPRDGDRQRLRALVVAPERSPRQVRDGLRGRLDPAFIPRPIVPVAQLPRNERGKLPADALQALLEQLGMAP